MTSVTFVLREIFQRDSRIGTRVGEIVGYNIVVVVVRLANGRQTSRVFAVTMPKSSKHDRCLPSTSSSSGTLLPSSHTDADSIVDKIVASKASRFHLPKAEKLIMLSKKSSCQVSQLPLTFPFRLYR